MRNGHIEPRPGLPIPEPIRGREPGTWAHNTIVKRLPDIGRRVLEENDFNAESLKAMQHLILELPETPVRHLHDQEAPDWAAWAEHIEPHRDQNWLDVPWFFAETYFYRRILEAIGYFLEGPGRGLDPFLATKEAGLEASFRSVETLCGQVQSWLSTKPGPHELDWLVHADLWGNQADLSLWPAQGDGPGGGSSAEHVLVDDTDKALSHLASAGPRGRVDFVLDNAGFELVADLALVVGLVSAEAARVIHLHIKAHPTFVSDAIEHDVIQTIGALSASRHATVAALGRQLESYHAGGTIHLRSHFYWNSPLSGWEMPADLRADLSRSDLVIVKGDANYRRLLGDRHWPFDTPFKDIMTYFPTAVLALRTLKGEIAAGLARQQIAHLQRADPDWLTNGRWGVIQFVR